MKPRNIAASASLLSTVVAAILLLVPLAAASGSGYSLSYTRAAGGTTNAAVDLISLTTSPGATTVSVTFQVSGTLDLTSTTYYYWVFFGGGAASNATAYAYFTNSAVNGSYFSVAQSTYSFGPLPYTLGSGGSSLTFSINQSAVGPAASFTANAFAEQGSAKSGTFTYIGTDYQGTSGGGGTCTSSSCSSTPSSSSSSLSGTEWLGIIGGVVVVLIVVVLVVVLVVLPRRKTPPQSPPPTTAGAAPPPPPASPPPGQ